MHYHLLKLNRLPLTAYYELWAGPHFTNDFSIVIQMWWKIGLGITPPYDFISVQNCVLVTTAQLSCHALNFITITSLKLRHDDKEISIEFEFEFEWAPCSEPHAAKAAPNLSKRWLATSYSEVVLCTYCLQFSWCPGKQLSVIITSRITHEKFSVDGQILAKYHEWACISLWANVIIHFRQTFCFFIFPKILKYRVDLVCAFTVISKK